MRVPFDVEKAFGSKQPKVKAMIEGVPYRGTLAVSPRRVGSRGPNGVRMGGPEHMLIVLKGIREKIGKTFGDEVKITVEEDVEPRVVKIPSDLLKEFRKSKAAKAVFDKLSFTHQKGKIIVSNSSFGRTPEKRNVDRAECPVHVPFPKVQAFLLHGIPFPFRANGREKGE